MNEEILEHELTLLDGKNFCLIRKGFGSQSDAWFGNLMVQTNNYPYSFQFIGTTTSTLFSISDILLLEQAKDGKLPIIRLKGPDDYNNPPKKQKYETVG